MKISCPACNANYRLPDDRIQGKNRIFKIACKRCGAEIRVRGVETPDEVGRTTLPFALDLPETAAAAQPPAQIWFAGIGGRQVGPLSEAEVLAELSSGRMSGDDMVWRKGFSAWTPVKDVPPFDDHVAVAPDVPADAAGDAGSKKSSPRRAQTLELSAAMIELLVKLDGQQPADGDAGPPNLQPPELPPLDAGFDAMAQPTPAQPVAAEREAPARQQVAPTRQPSPAAVSVAKIAGSQDDSDQVPTLVSAVKPAAPEPPPKPAPSSVKVSQPVAVAAKAAGAKAADAADEPPPAPAQAAKRTSQPSGPQTKQAAAATAADASEGSIRIRVPEEPAPARGKGPDVKVALPGQAGKGDGKGKDAKPAATPSIAPAASGPVGAAARAASVAANAAASTTPGSRMPQKPAQKSGGGAMIGIVLLVVFGVAAVVLYFAMSKGADPAPATKASEDASSAVAAAAAPDASAAPAPAPPPAPAPAPAPDVQAAAAAAPDAGEPKAEPAKAEAAVAAAEADKAKAEADKATAEKAAAEKAEADKAAAKAEEEKKSKDDAKAKAEKAEADKAAAEKAAQEHAAKAEADKQARAEKAAADKAKHEEERRAKEEQAQKKQEEAKKAAEERAAKAKDSQAAKEKAAADKKAAEDAKKAEREAAAKAKAQAAADKKAAEEAKKAADDAAKSAKSTKKVVSDDDVEELLRKHDKSKQPAEEEGLSQAQVSEIGKKAAKSVVNCYLLHADDQGEDTIKVQATVNSSGTVERAAVMGKHGNNKAMAGCISDAVKKIVFPQGSGASKKYTLQYRVGG